MSSWRVRQNKLSRQSDPVVLLRQQRIGRIVQNDPSTRSSRQVRTISLRTWKFIFIVVVALLILLLLTPKPQVPPGQVVLGTATNSEPINLDTIGTTIPPVNPIQDGSFGNSLLEALKTK